MANMGSKKPIQKYQVDENLPLQSLCKSHSLGTLQLLSSSVMLIATSGISVYLALETLMIIGQEQTAAYIHTTVATPQAPLAENCTSLLKLVL